MNNIATEKSRRDEASETRPEMLEKIRQILHLDDAFSKAQNEADQLCLELYGAKMPSTDKELEELIENDSQKRVELYTAIGNKHAESHAQKLEAKSKNFNSQNRFWAIVFFVASVISFFASGRIGSGVSFFAILGVVLLIISVCFLFSTLNAPKRKDIEAEGKHITDESDSASRKECLSEHEKKAKIRSAFYKRRSEFLRLAGEYSLVCIECSPMIQRMGEVLDELYKGMLFEGE